MTQHFAKFLYILSGSRTQLLLLLGMALFTSLLEVLGVGVIGPFIGVATNPAMINQTPVLQWVSNQINFSSHTHFIAALGLFLIFIFCFKSLFYILTNFYIFKFCFDQRRALVKRLFSSYLKAPYTFFWTRNSSSAIQNITAETSLFAQEYLQSVLSGAVNLVIVIVLLVLLARTNLLFLVMVLGILLAVAFGVGRLSRRLSDLGRIRSESEKGMVRAINHGLGGFKETRVVGCETYFEAELDHYSQQWSEAVTWGRSIRMIFPVLVQSGLIVVVVLFICISQFLPSSNPGALTTVMGVFAAASLRLIPSANGLINAFQSVRNNSYSVDVVYADLKAIEHLERDQKRLNAAAMKAKAHSPERLKPLSFYRALELQDVSYRYPNASENSIQNVSLKIQRGESIGLIGKSGAGKTTLVDIILGLLEPQQGNILVDGESIYENLRGWQDLVGYIPQFIFLTDDTIARNVAYGVPDAAIDYDRLQTAIKAAQLEDLVNQLPQGLDTKVGERGVRLSGGQRQRVGIARALYHEREVLVLDEATAALDNETEHLVSEAIQALSGQKTLIIIAHRLSTIQGCDRIYQLERGRIVRSGTFQEIVGVK